MWPLRGSSLLWPTPTARLATHEENWFQPCKLPVLAQAEHKAPSRPMGGVQRRECPDVFFGCRGRCGPVGNIEGPGVGDGGHGQGKWKGNVF